MPVDVPPWQTVYGIFRRWEEKGMTGRLHDALRDKLRALHGRDPPPTAGVVDSPSAQGAQPVGSDSRGQDKEKNVNGRQRFPIVDTLGLLLTVRVVPASVQDRDGARQLLVAHYFAHRRGRFLVAAGGVAGRFVAGAASIMKTTIEIVRKKSGQNGFQALPKRWVVARTLAWLPAHHRLVRDYARPPATSTSCIRWAMIRTMVRRIAHAVPVARWQPRANTKSK